MIILFILFTFAWAVFMFFVLSYLSGWRKLAEKYYYPKTFTGKTYSFRAARIKKVRFKGALTFGVNDEGLYMVPIFLFRLLHQPLLIPWSDLRAEPVRLFFFSGHQLTVSTMPNITIQVNESTWGLMKDYLE